MTRSRPYKEIAGLSAALVPQCQWPLRQWFRAPGMRYYHRPKPAEQFSPGSRFYDYIDPALRELCRLLHAHGLRTTASCQGHHHDRCYFEWRWEVLYKEARAVRRAGLVVKESERGEEYCFRDPSYRLPWSDFQKFWQDSQRHQSMGYLGVIIPSSQIVLEQRLREASRRLDEIRPSIDEAISRRVGGYLYHIVVESADAVECSRKWQCITGWFNNELSVE